MFVKVNLFYDLKQGHQRGIINKYLYNNFQVFETISKITPDRLTPGAKKKIMEN